MPKRKIKEEKPRKKISRKQLLLPPILVGAATLAGIIVMFLVPPPPVLGLCLKEHDIDSFNLYPNVQIFLNNVQVFLPDNIGKDIVNGKECIRVIHTDKIGDQLHIQYIRPVRLSMDDFLSVYSKDNQTIEIVNNSTGISSYSNLTLSGYDVKYSYFSEDGKFVMVSNITDFPPFQQNMLIRMNLTSSK